MKSFICVRIQRGRQYVSPRKIGTERGGNFGHKAGGAQRRPGNNANPLIMSKPELSAVQMRMTK